VKDLLWNQFSLRNNYQETASNIELSVKFHVILKTGVMILKK